MVWQPAIPRQTAYRLAIIAAVAALGIGAVAATSGTTAAADLSMGALSIAGANQTVNESVADVRLAATLNYDHNVPDAERRVVRLKAGKSADSLDVIAYRQTRDPAGDASGGTTLEGSLVGETAPFALADFQPPDAGNVSREVYVEASIEVQRADGDPVVHTVSDTATVTVRDDGTLEVSLGGTGNVTVLTQ